MDAVEVMINLERIQPYFQPIFSADEHRVIGYEILARYKELNDEIKSLGPFFQDENIPEEYRIDVDNYVLEKALKFLVNQDSECFIFINRDPNLLTYDHGEDFLDIVKKYIPEEKLHRIVLELTESRYKGDLDHLHHLLSYYKTYGIKIAVDHLGEDSSLDIIAQISPHILKVNLEQFRKSGWEAYRDVLYSISILARKIGATLLFESIETVYQLHFAWKNGGRYYQGFYLANPQANLIDKEILKDRFKKECHRFILAEKRKLERIFSIKNEIQEKIQELLAKTKKTPLYTEQLKTIAAGLNNISFRLYVCDEDGFQLSPNIFKKDGSWIVQHEYREKNWSWRPYFLENIMKMRNDKRGILSDSYNDIETGETIRTFSIAINEKDYLFVDVSYDFLYENDAIY
ncbi:EAL domain-containing protein [Peribacillus tepidiphilus]|uniref:EAL domain-containing protein n=1 Tax=Peribacillus tepidiphilus TaxID=2652445 RepID=UPI001292277F|nr:EAL domain-containing protein [Peribacillus tepidiphilus]